MLEAWKPVPGFDRYEVSDRGRVRSLRTRHGNRRYPQRIGATPGRQGYCRVGLRKEGKSYNHGVHQVVLMAFVGPRPDGMECIHLDDNKANNRLANLRWGTRSENQQMRIKTNPQSYKHPRRLTRREVKKLKDDYRFTDITQEGLAARLGISHTTVSKIINGHRWAAVEGA